MSLKNEPLMVNYDSLQAVHDASRCVDVVTHVGFGEAPFVYDGFELNSDHPLVFPEIPGAVASFPVDKIYPPNSIEFRFFKHNVMCRAQPWICLNECVIQ